MSTEQDTRSREMLATALTMEQKGMAFYEKAASDCSNEFGREMCLLLKDYENIHIERIKTIYDSLKGGTGWSDEWAGMKPSQDLGAVFIALAESHLKTIKSNAGDLEILDVGLDFETKSIDFYSKHLSEAGAVLEREFLDQMIIEEREHFRILSDMRQYYSDPAAWLMEKERVSLDGA